MEPIGRLKRLEGVSAVTEAKNVAEGTDRPLDLSSASFASFCAKHEPALTRALIMTLDDRELGRDAAAEGLTRAWQHWSTVREYANAPGWVYRVGVNWGRSRQRRRRREVSAALVPDRPSDDRSAERPDERLMSAIAGLSHDHRAVVVARYYLDWSERQIADALDLAPGTVKSRLHRALEQITRSLEEPT